MSERLQRLARRAVTIPGYFLAFATLLCLAPVLYPLLAVTDLARGTSMATVRALSFALHYLACEIVGILVSAWLWLARLFGRTDDEAWLARHYRLQAWWASSLLAGAIFFFRFRVEVTGDETVPSGSGPFVLLVRHVSIGDTLLAAVHLAARRGHRLRYVLKRELLWDPCLDIVGQRLPNCFVERGGQTSDREIARVRGLARGIGSGEGVLIYPEGTRFTPERRASIIARFCSAGQQDSADRAAALRHVLPPRLGGTLALLEERPDADVVVCMHHGFEGTMRAKDLLSGVLVGARIEVRFERIASNQIPGDRAGKEAWLFSLWERIDAWLASRSRD